MMARLRIKQDFPRAERVRPGRPGLRGAYID
jgi:hypothetical protein